MSLMEPETGEDPAVWQSMAMPRAARVTFEELHEAGIVTRVGDGAYATHGLLARLMSRLDSRIRTMAVERYGAEENCYPALVPTTVLHRAGYFDAFPQFLMTAGSFQPEAGGYRGFASEFSAAEDKPKFMDARTGHNGHCLSPAVCYHAYHQLAGKQLPDEGTVLTACGKVFRFESDQARTLERLWDFTMREVIFLGTREWVHESRRSLMEAVCALVDELHLAGYVEIANDPFFAGGASAKQVMVQRALKLKYELLLPVVEDRASAVTSFNLHGTKFGDAFDITTTDGSPAHSGCVAVGLERIAYAFLCRHGLDPVDWPDF